MKYIAMTPTYNGQDMLPGFFQNMDKMSPPPTYHIFVTNNCTDRTNSLIDKYLETHKGKRITYNLPKDFNKKMNNNYAAIGIARNICMREARKIIKTDLSYTHGAFIDDDIRFKNPAQWQNMANLGQPIVGGAYSRPFPEGIMLGSKWLIGGKVMGQPRAMKTIEEPTVTSAGVLLLNRNVMLDERLRFFPVYLAPGIAGISEDFSFCMLARSYGYRIWLWCGDVIGHLFLGTKERDWVTNPVKKKK